MATAELKQDQLQFLASGGSLLLRMDASQPGKLILSPGGVLVQGVQEIDHAAANPGSLTLGETHASSVSLGSAGAPTYAFGNVHAQNVHLGVGGGIIESVFTAGSAIQQWMVLRIGASNQVVPMTGADPYQTGIIGVATQSAASGQPVRVCLNGMFYVTLDTASPAVGVAIGTLMRRGPTEAGSVWPCWESRGRGAGNVPPQRTLLKEDKMDSRRTTILETYTTDLRRHWTWWFLLMSLSLVLLSALVIAPVAHELRKYSGVRRFGKGVRHRRVLLTKRTARLLRDVPFQRREYSGIEYNSPGSPVRAAVLAMLQDGEEQIGPNVVPQGISVVDGDARVEINPLRTVLLAAPLSSSTHETDPCSPLGTGLPTRST